MSRRLLFAASLVVACKAEPAPTQEKKPAPAGPRVEFVAAVDGEVAPMVRKESERALQDGRRLIVYVGATWCEPCRRFHEAATAGQLDTSLPPMRLLEFDLDRDEARLREAGYASEFIPLFALAGPDGRASGKQIAGSIKGPGAPDEITPRLLRMLRDVK